MNTRSQNKHIIDAVFVICLALLFVLSALSVIAIGADIYKKNVSAMESNNDRRIATAYVTEKVRQADVNGAVYAREIFDHNALILQEEINGQLYDTYIYEYEGALMELFARDDLEVFYPQSGQKIMNILSFDIEEITEHVLSVDITLMDGSTDHLYITKRSEEGG
ncbi:DUF4860 domain-containing protein [Butyrivibrio sp. FCS014]|uniref:DUF4860 domain-containing protein n=1 Tax=Butyrivibrio sp. FCS014 TaxID=1408304 RepID=UPI0004656C02|nr:DUF4860 domain-containing protein [Butyrivibrio sp. FCS014]